MAKRLQVVEFTIVVRVGDCDDSGKIIPSTVRGMPVFQGKAKVEPERAWEFFGGALLVAKNKEYLPDHKEIVEQIGQAKNQEHLDMLELQRQEAKRKGREVALRAGAIDP